MSWYWTPSQLSAVVQEVRLPPIAIGLPVVVSTPSPRRASSVEERESTSKATCSIRAAPSPRRLARSSGSSISITSICVSPHA
jgi:hypothetical protein